jgi:hypothetical protein
MEELTIKCNEMQKMLHTLGYDISGEKLQPQKIINQIEDTASGVYCLLKLDEYHYHVVRTQKNGVTSAINKYVKSHGLNTTPVIVNMWGRIRDPVKFHNTVRKKMSTLLYINRNDIWLIENGIGERDMILAIDDIHKQEN